MEPSREDGEWAAGPGGGAGLFEKKDCRQVRSWRCGARNWGAPVS